VASHDPEIRVASATKAGLALAARRTPDEHRAAMANAREGQRAKLIAEIDPTGELARTDPDELNRQLDIRRRLLMAELGLRSARARAARKAAEREAQAAADYDALAQAEGVA